MLPVLTVIATLQVGQLILQETALSFLGLGLPPPAATWGNIQAEGRDRLLVAPWIANHAGFSIALLVLGVNMLGNVFVKNSIQSRLAVFRRPIQKAASIIMTILRAGWRVLTAFLVADLRMRVRAARLGL